MSFESELDLGPPPAAPVVDFGDPLDALSGPPAAPPPASSDPFGQELSLDSLGPSPAPPGSTGELELDLGPSPAPASPSSNSDPFGSALDSPFAEEPAAAPPALEDPFGSALGAPPPAPPQVDSMMGLGAPGGSSSFTSDPVSAEASIEISAGALSANPVEITVPVELNLSGRGGDILVPIRLQLKIKVR
jgi:hypothetical protein